MLWNDEMRREQMRLEDIRQELIDEAARDLAFEFPGADPDELAYEATRMVEDARAAALNDMTEDNRNGR